MSVLGEQTVAGMDCVAVGVDRRIEHGVDVDVRLRDRRSANVRRAIGFADVQGVGVGDRVDGMRRNPEPSAGTGDAGGDLAAVGDQDTAEHGAANRRS